MADVPTDGEPQVLAASVGVAADGASLEITLRAAPIGDVVWPGMMQKALALAAEHPDDPLLQRVAQWHASQERDIEQELATYGALGRDLCTRYDQLTAKLGADTDPQLLADQMQLTAALFDTIDAYLQLTDRDTLRYLTASERKFVAERLATIMESLLPALNVCGAYLRDEITRLELVEQWTRLASEAA
jgi:hypothetical protein